jgi:hypothetical protein
MGHMRHRGHTLAPFPGLLWTAASPSMCAGLAQHTVVEAMHLFLLHPIPLSPALLCTPILHPLHSALFINELCCAIAYCRPLPTSPPRISQVNSVAVRYERPRLGESDNEIYSQGEVVPADKIIAAAGFKVRCCAQNTARARTMHMISILLASTVLFCLHGRSNLLRSSAQLHRPACLMSRTACCCCCLLHG